MNILFVMYDHLRFDYLSCSGHPHLHTPNFDRLAAMGMRFTEAYVQSPICGASRMCFYTGRYASSHGAQWNGFPLRVGEVTLGDHLRKLGMDAHLIGKTHMKVDAEGMARLGLSPDSIIGARQSECGFDAWIRDDGLWAQGPDGFYDTKGSPYNDYRKSRGYDGENPWADYANAGVDDDGNIASGWMFLNADKPANIREEDSETPWFTSQTMRFIEETNGDWLAHPRALWRRAVKRCKFHGGATTGPRTPEGRERIATAQGRRWARNAPETPAFRRAWIPANSGGIRRAVWGF